MKALSLPKREVSQTDLNIDGAGLKEEVGVVGEVLSVRNLWCRSACSSHTLSFGQTFRIYACKRCSAGRNTRKGSDARLGVVRVLRNAGISFVSTGVHERERAYIEEKGHMSQSLEGSEDDFVMACTYSCLCH